MKDNHLNSQLLTPVGKERVDRVRLTLPLGKMLTAIHVILDKLEKMALTVGFWRMVR